MTRTFSGSNERPMSSGESSSVRVTDVAGHRPAGSGSGNFARLGSGTHRTWEDTAPEPEPLESPTFAPHFSCRTSRPSPSPDDSALEYIPRLPLFMVSSLTTQPNHHQFTPGLLQRAQTDLSSTCALFCFPSSSIHLKYPSGHDFHTSPPKTL